MVDAFQVLPDLVKVVGRGHAHGLMVVGPGGVGKSFTVIETLANDGKVEGQDFIRIPGYSSPAALYNNLHEYNGKVIVFDDCDSIFSDPTGLNILKPVLDTLPQRKVS